MKITIKRVGAVLLAVLILASAAVGVSAAYVDMLDHGLFFSPNNFSSGDAKIFDSGGAGTYNGTVHAWVPMWALDSYEPGKTYTMTFSCVVPTGVNVSFNYEYIVLQHEKVNILPLDADLPKAYHSASFDSSTGKLTFVVKFNTDVSDLGGYPVYIYLYSVVNSQIYNKMISNQWSTSVEYDPGGSKFLEEYLDRIINAGSDYPLPDDAATSLDSGVSSINSAEGELTGKSSSLMDSVSEEWTANKNTAKTFLTTIQPTAVQVKNFYTTLTTALPDEVKALFAIIPLLLFIGYLLGRVK